MQQITCTSANGICHPSTTSVYITLSLKEKKITDFLKLYFLKFPLSTGFISDKIEIYFTLEASRQGVFQNMYLALENN